MTNIKEFKPRAEGTITLTNAEALSLFQSVNILQGLMEGLANSFPDDPAWAQFGGAGLKLHDHLGKAGLLSCCDHKLVPNA